MPDDGHADHRLLALWAADCAERVLPLFEAHSPADQRPRSAIEAARAWARGELSVGAARAAAFAAHAAARDVEDTQARAAARAAGHAAATAHVVGHARHAAAYAVTASSADPDGERAWQDEHRPVELTDRHAAEPVAGQSTPTAVRRDHLATGDDEPTNRRTT